MAEDLDRLDVLFWVFAVVGLVAGVSGLILAVVMLVKEML